MYLDSLVNIDHGHRVLVGVDHEQLTPSRVATIVQDGTGL